MNTATAFYPAARLSDRLAALSTRAVNNLRLTAVHNGRAVLLGVCGDIDAANADTWRRVLVEVDAAVDPPGALLIDLRGVGFVGHAAFAVLEAQSRQCRRRGIHLRLISTASSVSRTIAACGWSGELPVFVSVDAALALDHRGGECGTTGRSRSARTKRPQRAHLR